MIRVIKYDDVGADRTCGVIWYCVVLCSVVK